MMQQNLESQFGSSEAPGQTIPVRIYHTEERIMIAAPMPGLEPQDISVTINGNQVAIRGDERAPRQDHRDLIAEEWRIGPYYREVSLPENVDGPLSNATYGNGVLVLSLPKMKQGGQVEPVNFQLHPLSVTQGERVGHTGQAIRPTTTAKHSKKHR
jgi:HSP20 family protein